MRMANATATLPTESITPVEICELFRYTRRDLGRLVQAGKFPKPFVAPTPGLSRWRRSDIETFLAEQTSQGAAS